MSKFFGRAPDGARLTVDTTALPANTEVPKLTEFPNNAKIRRWDTNQLADTANPVRALSIDKPIELEDGVQVQFKPGTYRTGDYWLIPARTTGGQIEWPGRQDDEIYWPPYPAGVDASFEPAAGIEHHDGGAGGIAQAVEQPIEFDGLEIEIGRGFEQIHVQDLLSDLTLSGHAKEGAVWQHYSHPTRGRVHALDHVVFDRPKHVPVHSAAHSVRFVSGKTLFYCHHRDCRVHGQA